MARMSSLSPETLAYLGTTRDVPVLARLAVEFAACLSRWTTRRRTRMALRQLDIWQLDDVGLTPLEADREASKAFWRP